MMTDIDSLEQKIDLVLSICGQLRIENRALREQKIALEQHNQLLIARAAAACTRLEALAEKLPAE